jgi:hypothetical protein
MQTFRFAGDLPHRLFSTCDSDPLDIEPPDSNHHKTTGLTTGPFQKSRLPTIGRSEFQVLFSESFYREEVGWCYLKHHA